MKQESDYKCVYVACVCPKCREEIALKVYAKQPIISAEIAEPLGEEAE